MSRARTLWTLGLASLIVSPSIAAVVQLTPIKDNSLIQGANPASQLSNGQGDISSGRTNQDGQNPATISIRRGLLAFDIAGAVPAGATITDVTLTMRELSGMNGDRATSLYRTLQDWGEGNSFQAGSQGAPAQQNDATWLYRFFDTANPTGSPAWTTPGGDFVAASSGSTIVSDDLGPNQFFTWDAEGMVADVQSWLNQPAVNFGWTILGDESMGQTSERFNSGESAVPPLLTVTYVIPEPSALLLSAAGLATVATLARRRVMSSNA